MPNVAESPKTGRAGPPKVVELDSVAFYLNVAYDERAKAKALDAQWDGSRRAWYAPRGSEAALASYKVEQVVTFANGAGSPEQEFARALRDAGLDVDAPEMDGKIHRVPVIGGKSHSKDGAYCGSVDGVPHGFVQNHKTGLKVTWRSESAAVAPMSASHRAAWAAQTELVRHRRDREAEAAHEAASAEATAKWSSMGRGRASCAYADRKGVEMFGAKEASGSMVIPIRDVDGRIWSLQTIDRDGVKMMMKGGKKAGNFHLIGEIKPGSDILIAEGYATAATLHVATGGLPVVVAFDAGNLLPAARALARRHPNSMLAFMADNDRFGTANTGVDKARAAAAELGGAMVSPDFGGLEGKLTDWNDLALATSLEAARAQIGAGLKAERARLRDLRCGQAASARAAQGLPARIETTDCQGGRYRGAARPLGSGFVAIESKAGISVHEARRLGVAIEPARKLSVAYEKGRASVAVLNEVRQTAQALAPER